MRYAFVLLSVVAVHGLSAQERTTLGGRDVLIWKPKAPARAAPVVVFSHGFGGCAQQSKFFTEALANNGYFVVAPNHRDARCDRDGRTDGRLEDVLRDPEEWSDQSFVDRRDDIRAVVQALKESPRYRDAIDLGRLALTGHSLGGYTVLGLAGGWPTWRMPGVKAVLAMSPSVRAFLIRHTLGSIDAAVMYQGGTLDFRATPPLRRADGAYAQSSAPRYYVEFAGAGHFAWTDLRTDVHQRILDYALPFLDRYVRDLPVGARLMKKAAGVSDLRFDTTYVRR